MSKDSQTNIYNLDETYIHQAGTPSVNLATLGISGATEYSSGKKYHRYIPILNDQGRLDSSFLSGVEVTIAQKTTGSYYYVDLINGYDSENGGNGSVQNPYKTFSEASNEGFKNGISTFILKSGKPESEGFETITIPEDKDTVYITSDGYGIAEIPELKITTAGSIKTVYIKDITIDTIWVNIGSSVNLYLLGSSALNGIYNGSTGFDIFISADATINTKINPETTNLKRLVYSENIQYNKDSSLNEKISSIDADISDSKRLIAAHEGNKGNPHVVTPKQIGALPLCGGGVVQGCIYYDTESDDTRLVDKSYVDTTIASDISSHNDNGCAHSALLSNYAKKADQDSTSARLTAHIDNKDNPHELYLVNMPSMEYDDSKYSRLWLASGNLKILNNIAVPTTFTIASGEIIINYNQTTNFKSVCDGKNIVFKRYPYNRVTRDSSYSCLNAQRIYYYFMVPDLENLINPETGEYIQLSDDWLRGYVYITLNTQDENLPANPWLANKISIVPHPLNGSDLSDNTIELEWLNDSELGYVFKGTIGDNNDYLYSSTVALIGSTDVTEEQERTLVLTSRDIDTTGILNCIGEIKDSIDNVDNKTSSLEGELNELTDEFDKLKDDLIEGGEVTIIATETKAIVSEDKKATVSISENNRLEMRVKSTIDGEDLCTLRYFLTDSYDANIVTPLIKSVTNLESKTIDLFFSGDQLVVPAVKPPNNPCIDITGAENIVIGKDIAIYTSYNMAIGEHIQLTQNACSSIAIGNQISMVDKNVAVGSCIITEGGSGVAYGEYIKLGGSSVAMGGYVNNDTHHAPCSAAAVGYKINGCENSVALGLCITQNDSYNISIGSYIKSGCQQSVAIGNCIDASYTNSIVLGGYESSVPRAGILIGCGVSLSDTCTYSVGIGRCITVGRYSHTFSIGNEVNMESDNSQIGLVFGHDIDFKETKANSDIAIGAGSCVNYTGAYFGNNAYADNISIGYAACITISGDIADETNRTTIQLGTGTNTNLGSLQFRDYPLFDDQGEIYPERLVLKDTDNGKKYQLTVTNGVLGVTEVTEVTE